MKKTKHKGYIVPIIIVALFLVYMVLYFGLIIMIVPGIWKLALAVIPTIMTGVIILVLVERIKEIRSGEEDDLSKY